MDGGKDVESVVASGNRNLCCHFGNQQRGTSTNWK